MDIAEDQIRLRFVNVGGALVVVWEDQEKGVQSWYCHGCLDKSMGYDIGLGGARQFANKHATACRALPGPDSTRAGQAVPPLGYTPGPAEVQANGIAGWMNGTPVRRVACLTRTLDEQAESMTVFDYVTGEVSGVDGHGIPEQWIGYSYSETIADLLRSGWTVTIVQDAVVERLRLVQ